MSESQTSKITTGVLTTLIGASALGLVGGIANFIVMRYEVEALREEVRTHTAREGHEQGVRRVDRIESRLDSSETISAQRQATIDRRLEGLETTLGAIQRDQREILRSLPSAWRTREPER